MTSEYKTDFRNILLLFNYSLLIRFYENDFYIKLSKNIKKKQDICYYAHYRLQEKLELYNVGNVIKLSV